MRRGAASAPGTEALHNTSACACLYGLGSRAVGGAAHIRHGGALAGARARGSQRATGLRRAEFWKLRLPRATVRHAQGAVLSLTKRDSVHVLWRARHATAPQLRYHAAHLVYKHAASDSAQRRII